MTGGDRGPSGSPSLPPAWLATVSLPILTLPAGRTLVRVHRLDSYPVFFSPGAGAGPVGRFGSPTGAFGVLHLARSLAGAFAETVLRNPQRRLAGAGHRDNAVSTGPYGPYSAWADALHGHPDWPDGITYASRHSPNQLCVALFSRDDLTLDVVDGPMPMPLTSLSEEVAGVLRHYGKGIA